MSLPLRVQLILLKPQYRQTKHIAHMANDVFDSVLHRKLIIMRVSNVHCAFILDSFYFTLLLFNCKSHHLLSAASWLMRPDHLSWDATLFIHVAIKPPTFHASWVLLKITVIKEKMLFPHLLCTSIKAALYTRGHSSRIRGLSFECSLGFCRKKDALLGNYLLSVWCPTWFKFLCGYWLYNECRYDFFIIFDPFTGQFLLTPDEQMGLNAQHLNDCYCFQWVIFQTNVSLFLFPKHIECHII